MSHPLTVAIDAFFLDCRARRLKPKTIIWYKDMLSPFLQWLQSENMTTLEQITASAIRLYLLQLEERGLMATSQHGAARSIRVFLNFCVREDWLSKSPMRKVQMPRVGKKILPSFTPEEVQRILGACTCERDRAIVLFFLDTGLRLQECANVTMDMIDLQNGSVFVRNGKGGKDRIVYFGDRTRKQLMKYFMELGEVPESGALWRSWTTGEHFQWAGIKTMLQRVQAETRITHCSAHTFRRTFAIWNLRAGMNIYELQRLMGHSDLKVLERYLDMAEADVSAAHKRVGAVDKML